MSATGHRQRLRDSFLAGDKVSRTDETLLELLLTYAIPQKDVMPVVRHLIEQFGDLSGVLAATPGALCGTPGVKSYAAALIKLVDLIRSNQNALSKAQKNKSLTQGAQQQQLLLDIPAPNEPVVSLSSKGRKPNARRPVAGYGTELFGKAALKDAIQVLPGLPDTNSLDEIRKHLRSTLHYSAERTRERVAAYITRRMFPSGEADRPLRLFARQFAGTQDLREVCYYRFMQVEPIVAKVVEELLIPAVGAGQLNRERIRDYLQSRYPTSKSIRDCVGGLAQVFEAAGIAKSDRVKLRFGYRDVPLAAFIFVLHSEYPGQGMHDLGQAESNRAFRCMLWNPDKILPALYELRNRGLISKISEIDSVRQFTTKYTLNDALDFLVGVGNKA